MSKVVITLEEADMLELQEILLDDDASAALEFIKNNIAGKVPGKGSHNCDSTRLNPYLLKSDD